jgi:hypothetical protein
MSTSKPLSCYPDVVLCRTNVSQSIGTQTIQSLQKKHLHDNSPILTTAVPSADGQGDSEHDTQISDIDFCFLLDPENLSSSPLVHSGGSSTSSTTRDSHRNKTPDLGASGMLQHKPVSVNTSGPHEYVSREESQQRRLQNAAPKTAGSDSEDDLFGREHALRLRLRQAKMVAATELAQVSTTFMPKQKNKVQGGQTCRSMPRECIIECLGDDDPSDSYVNSQTEMTIADLQSPIVDAPSPRAGLNNGAVLAKKSFNSFNSIGSDVAKGEDSVVGNQSPVRFQSPTHAAGTDGIYNRSTQDVVANKLRKPMSEVIPIQNPLRLFSSMAFAISYKGDTAQDKEDRTAVTLLIKAHGGHLLNGFDDLFTDGAAANPTLVSYKQNGELVPAPAARDLSFVAFIGDHYTRKSKFVQALALGLPCLSSRWVMDCVARELTESNISGPMRVICRCHHRC